jgi:4-amino-4-deoxy-L-arabinose transferase-like glycosyltransferase
LAASSLVVAFTATLTALRLTALQLGGFDLDFEEAQYWTWAREFSFGYFSKPPMIAWTIGAMEAVCGSGPACIRSAAPLFHAGTTLFVFAIARHLYGDHVAVWSAVLFALSPGLAFSARLITTDVPLLFFWALSLLLALRLVKRPSLPLAIGLGLAVGGGLLSKYAMAYFYACAVLAALLLPDLRRVLASRYGVVVLAVSLAVYAPNLAWNIGNEFHTFIHTGENIRGGGLRINPGAALAFLAAQFGIGQPIVVALAAARAVGFARRPAARDADILLLCFSLPIILTVAVLGLVRGANANWAAPAFVALSIVGTAVLLRTCRAWLVQLTFGVAVLVQLVLFVGDHFAGRISLPGPRGPFEPYARVTGWPATAAVVAEAARSVGARTVVTDHRPLAASLTYYLRDLGLPVSFWLEEGTPLNFFATEVPLTSASPGAFVMVSLCPFHGRYEQVYRTVRPLGPRTIPTGPTSVRRLYLFLLAEPAGPIGRLSICR